MFESTNAILGIGESERAKKNDRWKKLMDIASLGTDIWGTLSGRKYNTSEREAAQDFTRGERIGAEGATRALAQLNAELDEARAAGDQARAMELQQEIARLQGERDKTQFGYDLQLTREGQGANASQERITRMRQAITEGLKSAVDLRPDWFIPDPRDPTGASFVPNPATVKELRENIMKAIMMERPSQAEIDAVTPYLEDLLSGKASAAPPTPAKGGSGKPQATELAELKTAYQNMFSRVGQIATKELNPKYPLPAAAAGTYRDIYGKVLDEIDDFNVPADDIAAARMAIEAINVPAGKISIADQVARVKAAAQKAKEAIDALLKKHNLLPEVFAPRGY